MADPAPNQSAGVSLALTLAAREAAARGIPHLNANCLWLATCRVAELARNPALHRLSLPAETLRGIEHESQQLLHLFETEELDPRHMRLAVQSYLPPALRSEDSLAAPQFAGDLQRVLTNARARARSRGQTRIELAHLMQAFLSDPTPEVAREMLRAMPEPGEESIRRAPAGADAPATDTSSPSLSSAASIQRLGRDLVPAARDGQLRFTFARLGPLDQLLHAFGPDGAGCALLIGEPGVGRTSLVHGLARRISQGRVPPWLKDRPVIELPGGGLRAASSDAGSRAAAFEDILHEARRHPEAILFIDDVELLVRDTASSPGRVALTDLLRSALSGQPVPLIATVDSGVLDEEPQLTAALSGLCEIVQIEEPSFDEAISIVSDCRNELEARYQLSVDDSAVDAAVVLSARFMGDRRLPDKALDVLDDACAGRSLDSLVLAEGGPVTVGPKTIGRAHVVTAIADRIGVPRDLVAADDAARVRFLRQELEQKLLDQGGPIDQLAGIVAEALGRHPLHQPLATVVVIGDDAEAAHTMAATAARVIFGDSARAVRFEPEQYRDGGLSARLLGTADGPPGELTMALRRTPGAVVLIDGLHDCTDHDLATLRDLLADQPLTDRRGRQIVRRNALFLLSLGAHDPVKADRVLAALGGPDGGMVVHPVRLRPPGDEALDSLAGRLLARVQLRLAFAGRPVALPDQLAGDAVRAIAGGGNVCTRELERAVERVVQGWLATPPDERKPSPARVTPPTGILVGQPHGTTTIDAVLPTINAMLRSSGGGIHQLRAGPMLTVGRGERAGWTVFLVPRTVENDEATRAISREHLLVRPTLRGFSLEPGSPTAHTMLPHGPLTAAGSPVMPDMRITLGGVLQMRLRLFHDQPAMASTVRLPAPAPPDHSDADDDDTHTTGDVPTNAVALFQASGACRSLVMTRVNNRPGESCVVLVGRCLIGGSHDAEVVVDGAPAAVGEVVPAGPDLLQLRALASGLWLNGKPFSPGDPPHDLATGDCLAFDGTNELLTFLQRPSAADHRPDAGK